MSLLQIFKYVYHKHLPKIILHTTVTSFSIGIINNNNSNISYNNKFINIVRITTAGYITAIAYPVSFPIISFIYLHKTVKHYIEN